MRNLFVCCIVILSMATASLAQVSVSTDNRSPHESAMLDVKSTSKGALMPRMTFEQRNTIPNPAEGLMVYCTNCNPDGTGCVSIFVGSLWKTVDLSCHEPNIPAAGIHIPEVTQITWNWTAVPIAAGYKWNTEDNYATAVNMGTSLTKTETGLACNSLYSRYVWAYNPCGISTSTTLTQATTSTPGSAPTAGIHVALAGQVIWKWNAVAGATGYKWNTTNDYASAENMGASLSKTETGLTCNTLYTRYVWANNPCGISAATTMTKTTSNTLLSPEPGTNVLSQTQIIWNWNSVSGATGYRWSTTNNYSTATDMGLVTSKTETGLTSGTTYTRYVWAYSSCGISAVTNLTQTFLFIGQSHAGGIVVYIDVTGQHGLVATPGDQSSFAEWGCYGTSIPGTSTTIGAGQANTTAIVNGCSTAGIAARLCNSLIFPPLSPYFDWFLPSKNELNQLYLHKDVVGGFAAEFYWSSSDYNANGAWGQDFSNGAQYSGNKSNPYYVRAVRAF